MTRQEVKQAFNDIVAKYGKPQRGEIYFDDQLIAKIAYDLCAYSETYITYENGQFLVSPMVCMSSNYADDFTAIGKVKADEWYTPEQRRAMHEVAFGYMF